jgi:hypothetical protein
MIRFSVKQQRRCTWSTRLLVLAMATAILLTMIPRGGIAAAEGGQAGLINGNAADVALTEEGQHADDTPGEVGVVVAPEDPTETPEAPGDMTDAPADPTGTPEPVDDVTTADEERQPADIRIFKFVCPAGIDPALVDLAATCTDTMVAHFEIFKHFDGTTLMADGDYLQFYSESLVGQIDIRETIPAGMLDPWVSCYDVDTMMVIFNGSAFGGFVELPVASGQVIICNFFNLPMPEETEPSGTIEIKKWVCPEGFMGNSWEEYLAACTMTMNDVPFYAMSNNVNLPVMTTGDSGDGSVIWAGLEACPVVIQEGIPAGYGEPVVYCGFTGMYYNDAGVPAIVDGFIGPDGVDVNVLEHDLLPEGYLYCDWFNIPTDDGYGSITIYKHTCEAGYDVNAPGANPWLDCPELTNGVLFTLYHGADVPLQTMTGDSIDGAVSWGGLAAGDYQVQETLPADTAYAFVSGCYNNIADAPAPVNMEQLQGGDTLLVEVHEGEDWVCHWYNVPNQHGGTVVITKYWCDGHVYSTYACEIYEGGATFQIGGTQVVTGWNGMVSIDLSAGAYELDEVGGMWCYAESSNIDQYGQIVVADGETTYVTVFNCGPRETPKGKPVPGKFPNTGLGPVMSEQLAA